MNKNAEAFKAYLDEKDIKVFEIEELEGDEQKTAVFRSHVTTEGQQLPTVVILDESIFALIRVQISPKALMEKNLAEYKAIALETRADVRVLTAQIGTLEAHISAMEYWGAIIIGAATIAFGLAQYFQSKRETIASKVREEVNELRKTVLALVDAGKIAASR